MNDNSQNQGTGGTGMALMGFALGAAVGAGLALLLAPDSGRTTRERLASTARSLSKNAGYSLEHARDAAVELGTDAKSALKAGQDAFLHDRASRDSGPERGNPVTAGISAVVNAAKRSLEDGGR